MFQGILEESNKEIDNLLETELSSCCMDAEEDRKKVSEAMAKVVAKAVDDAAILVLANFDDGMCGDE